MPERRREDFLSVERVGGRRRQHVKSSVLSMVPGLHWGSQNTVPAARTETPVLCVIL